MKLSKLTLNLANTIKKAKIQKDYKRISRLCEATVVKVGNTYKAKVNLLNNGCNSDCTIVSFTPESYELKGKSICFSRFKNAAGNYIRYIRTLVTCTHFPGNPNQLSPFKEGLIVSGYLVKDGLYNILFEFKDIHRFNEDGKVYNDHNFDKTKPLINE